MTQDKPTDDKQESQPPRALRARQRQKLIDACISALHIHGPSKTTVEKVVAIAQMSPGIVRFYFSSKDAMLVAALEWLAAEFEEKLLVPVTALAADPVIALQRLVELYLGAELASTRKVSVWYSFWGEASSRQEYYEICGSRDAKFERLVRELIDQLIRDQRATRLDPDAIALGLTGVLELLWQSLAFQAEEGIDRAVAKRRAMAYLGSIFPGAFGDHHDNSGDRLEADAYRRPGRHRRELTLLLSPSWQFIGLDSDLPNAGDTLALDTAAGPAMLVRNGRGQLKAFRNACPRRAHLLLLGRSAHVDRIHCELHDLDYDLDGEPIPETPAPGLMALESRTVGPMVFVRHGASPAPPLPELSALTETLAPRLAGTVHERTIEADWKLLVELWLERATPGGQFLAPNQWLLPEKDGFRVLQVMPLATGISQLREMCYQRPDCPVATPSRLATDAALAESLQRSLESPPTATESAHRVPPAVAHFRQSVAALDVAPRLPGDLR